MALVVAPDMRAYVGALAFLAIVDPDKLAYDEATSVLIQQDMTVPLFVDQLTSKVSAVMPDTLRGESWGLLARDYCRNKLCERSVPKQALCCCNRASCCRCCPWQHCPGLVFLV
jgi:hypothetical protein